MESAVDIDLAGFDERRGGRILRPNAAGAAKKKQQAKRTALF